MVFAAVQALSGHGDGAEECPLLGVKSAGSTDRRNTKR